MPENEMLVGTARDPREEVFERLFREGHRFDFFQAVRLLERYFPDAPAPGTTAALGAEPIRFRPDPTPIFPATDVKRIEKMQPSRNAGRARVTVTFMGLYGVDSPLPYYFYNDLAAQSEDTSALREFLDVFNHRLYAFFYRAWKKYRPALHYQRGGSDQHARRLLSVAGLGTPGALRRAASERADRSGSHAAPRRAAPSPAAPASAPPAEASPVPVPRMRLAAFAGRLMNQQRNAEGLRALVAGFFEGLTVRIVENVPRWVPIREKPTMGDGQMELGRNTTVGDYVYDLTSRFRIFLGGMDRETYQSLLPGGEAARRLHWLVRSYVPDHLDYEVKLSLPASEAPTATLGGSMSQLGQTTFLGTPTDDEISCTVEYTH